MFYTVIIQNNETPAIFAYNTIEDALAKFHAEMAYRHESRFKTVCGIYNEDLVPLKSETYVAPVPEPNAEPTEG